MYQIREASEKDIPEIIEVVKSSWFAVYPDFIPLEVLNRISAQRHTLAQFYSGMFTKDSYNPVVIDDNRIIGMALVFNNQDMSRKQGFIRRFYFLPEYQGRGLGTKLMEHLVEVYQDADMLLLEVEELNRSAVKFYQKMRFNVYKQGIQNIEGLELNYYHMMRIIKIGDNNN